jgi:hypothetical protein
MGITKALGLSHCRTLEALGVTAGFYLLVHSTAALAADAGRFCSATALRQFDACRSEVKDDLFTDRAICINVSDGDEREECFAEANAGQKEGRQLCREQFRARLDLCADLGEARYDPDFDPAGFTRDFMSQNPYFPLNAGNQWAYVGGEETITVETLDKTKLIEGVTCIVVNDRVEEDGEPVENTDDWYAQAVSGDVHYCGEIARNFEIFEGDDPEEAELVDVEGSWKAGRDGDRPGIIFLASPRVGDVYRQEWSPGNAEDVATVLSTTYGFGRDPELDEFVPEDLASLLCADDCVVTGETTAIEPDVFERKYYAPGIGLFLEVDPESGDIVQLVGCNLDPRCAMLPTPMDAGETRLAP